MFRPSIEITQDGSATLRCPLRGETYHSVRGAVGESRHVFVEAGFCRSNTSPVHILELGFGTGLNAWLTFLESCKEGRKVKYTGVELHPVPEDVAAGLNYSDDLRFMAMHRSEWGCTVDISSNFSLTKINANVVVSEIIGTFDVVYHDAFAPDTQPELWTPELFKKIYGMMSDGGVLVTYSAKGSVRRAIQAAGFEVEKLPGALGKRHMLRASRNGDSNFSTASFLSK